ncbi:FmdB family zinc ribbon protein [Chloroflexus sp.]|uniref:FmdB family zinc ribbon protein n=1 Tax=Chloroflexus sp. TaxID=1904827 RepID=UPI00261CD114|nr:zinc ribbon domain-containing protein [uncultured Chloroflexus sp.]
MYEYSCLDCARQFERLLPMNATDQTVTCPFCQSAQTRRRLSLFAAHSRGEAVAMASAPATTSGGCGCSGCSCGSRS